MKTFSARVSRGYRDFFFLSSSFFIHSEIKPASHHFCLSSGVLLRFRELQGFPGTCSECFHTRQAALGLAGWSEREKAR